MNEKDPISFQTLDRIKDHGEHMLAVMLLTYFGSDFSLYHEPQKITANTKNTSKHLTIPDFLLAPQPKYKAQTKNVFFEMTKSNTLLEYNKTQQKKVAYAWLENHPEAAYLQLCQTVLDNQDFSLAVIDQLAHGHINSQDAQQQISNYIYNPVYRERKRNLHFY